MVMYKKPDNENQILEEYEEQIEKTFYDKNSYPKRAICLGIVKVCTDRDIKIHEDAILERLARKKKKA